MSGPVQPPLTVTTVGGTPSGRPITTIKVSDGDLTISGNVATIDTSGSGGTPGGSDTQIQFNNSGAFGGDAGFTMAVEGGGDNTAVQIGKIKIGAGGLIQNNTQNGFVFIYSEGTGQIFLTGSTDGGGTFTDSVVNIMKNTLSDSSQLKFRDGTNVENATITETSGELNVKSNVDAKDITLETKTTGLTRVKNQTTNTDTQLNIQGNGTGTPKINLSNDSKAVTIQCDENQKLKIIGSSDDFIFDVSSGTGGITFPDGTTQTTAASAGIGGSIANTQVAVGSGTDTILGSNGLLFNGTSFTVNTLSASDPVINMSSSTKSVSLEVNASQKLTVKGASNSFVFDASSGSGGITFPDGTVQTSAASAGSPVGNNAVALPSDEYSGSARDSNLYSSMNLKFGPSMSDSGYNPSSTNTHFWPYFASNTGDITKIQVRSGSGVTGNCLVGFYNASDAGLPTTLIGSATLDVSTTGNKSQTSFSSTITTVRGKLYFIGVCFTSSSNTIRGPIQTSLSNIQANMTNDRNSCIRDTGTSGSLPSSFDISNSSLTETNGPPSILIGWN